MNGCLASRGTYLAILELEDRLANARERELAKDRLRQYRRSELYANLRKYGISIETSENISEGVWDVDTPWITKSYHRNPIRIQGV